MFKCIFMCCLWVGGGVIIETDNNSMNYFNPDGLGIVCVLFSARPTYFRKGHVRPRSPRAPDQQVGGGEGLEKCSPKNILANRFTAATCRRLAFWNGELPAPIA